MTAPGVRARWKPSEALRVRYIVRKALLPEPFLFASVPGEA